MSGTRKSLDAEIEKLESDMGSVNLREVVEEALGLPTKAAAKAALYHYLMYLHASDPMEGHSGADMGEIAHWMVARFYPCPA